MSLKVQPQNNLYPKFQMKNIAMKNNPSFKGETAQSVSKTEYENPISKKWEYFSASLLPLFGSAIAGVATGVIMGSEQILNLNKKLSLGVGAAVGLGVLALTLPSKLYHTSVRIFGKTKEMDVYSRSKSAETTISEKIDEQAKSNDVPVEKAIDNYFKFQVGRRGNSLGIVNSN